MMYSTRERKMKSMDTATAQVHAELRSESMQYEGEAVDELT
jgi:hypothetical protein